MILGGGKLDFFWFLRDKKSKNKEDKKIKKVKSKNKNRKNEKIVVPKSDWNSSAAAAAAAATAAIPVAAVVQAVAQGVPRAEKYKLTFKRLDNQVAQKQENGDAMQVIASGEAVDR